MSISYADDRMGVYDYRVDRNRAVWLHMLWADITQCIRNGKLILQNLLEEIEVIIIIIATTIISLTI